MRIIHAYKEDNQSKYVFHILHIFYVFAFQRLFEFIIIIHLAVVYTNSKFAITIYKEIIVFDIVTSYTTLGDFDDFDIFMFCRFGSHYATFRCQP